VRRPFPLPRQSLNLAPNPSPEAHLPAPVNPNLARALTPPIMEVQRWVRETAFPADRALLNLSQAAPVEPPPRALAQAMAEASLDDPGAHLYGPVLGDTPLREAIAEHWSVLYGASIDGAEVCITSGCNQAFCTAAATLCAPGDAVMVPVPWYFNHKMWLDMTGVEAIPGPRDDAMPPEDEPQLAPEQIEAPYLKGIRKALEDGEPMITDNYTMFIDPDKAPKTNQSYPQLRAVVIIPVDNQGAICLDQRLAPGIMAKEKIDRLYELAIQVVKNRQMEISEAELSTLYRQMT